MSAPGFPVADGEEPVRPSGLLDVLRVASVVLDAEGRIVLWSPQAEELFGYPAQEALGEYAARIMVHEQHLDLVVKLFADVMDTGQSWAGAFPVRRKDGSTRLVEFRNMRLLDDHGDVYALGLCADRSTVRRLERDVALSTRMIAQSPIGLAVLDTDLRYVSVNPALERINGLSAEDHVGRSLREVLPQLDVDAIEAAAQAGAPDRAPPGRPADRRPDHGRPGRRARLVDLALPAGGRGRDGPGRGQLGRGRHRTAPGGRGGRGRAAPAASSSPTPPPASAPPWSWTAPPVNWPTSPCRNSPTSPPSTCSTPWWPAGAAAWAPRSRR